MKKILLVIGLILFSLGVANSQVTLPHHEPFNYTVGEVLQNQSGWEALNVVDDDILISTASLSLTGLNAPTFNKINFNGNGTDAAKLFIQQTSGTVYYSFLLNVYKLGSLGNTGGHFTGFTTSNNTEFGGTVWLRKRGEGYQVGLNPRSSQVSQTIWSTDTVSINKTIIIVISYQIFAGIKNDVVSLWLNPSPASFGVTAPTPTLSTINNTGQPDLANLNRILIRQDDATSTPFIEMDELRVATIWAGVTPPISGLPLITVNPPGLIDFNYFVGLGPSVAQDYSLVGTNLDGSDVTITSPTNYEISSNFGSSWGSILSFTGYGTSLNETISVRLKAGLPENSYNDEIITNAGGGVSAISVNCNGMVNPLPPLQLFEENFDYASGQLTDAPSGSGANVSGGSWASISGLGNYINVIDGNLTYINYPSSAIGRSISINSSTSSSEDVRRGFADITSNKIYVSFLVNIANTTGLDETEGNYFVHFTNIGGTGSGYHGRLYVRAQGSNIQFGIRARSDNATSWFSTLFSTGATYLVVLNYEIVTGDDNNITRLWINPDLSGTEPTADAISTCQLAIQADPDDIDALGIRQGYDGNSTTPNAIIDGIRIATNWSNAPLPVELSSFTAKILQSGVVQLSWRTEMEVDNYGFEIERISSFRPPYKGGGGEAGGGWEKIRFVEGHGNSNSPKDYSFVDNSVTGGKLTYRLKQIDTDGKFEYSKIIEVDLGSPGIFALSQNYPNPFNPVTTIRYSLPQSGNVKLVVYNLLGEQVAELVNGIKEAGVHTINFNTESIGAGLQSGLYIYKIEANGFVRSRKMTLIK